MNNIRPVLALLLLTVGALSLSSCGYDSKGTTIGNALTEQAKTIPGAGPTDVHVNSNTSGNFMTVKITADTSDESEMKLVLEDYLYAILNDQRVEDGTLSISVFSPDEQINLGPSDLGYAGPNTTREMRGFFG